MAGLEHGIYNTVSRAVEEQDRCDQRRGPVQGMGRPKFRQKKQPFLLEDMSWQGTRCRQEEKKSVGNSRVLSFAHRSDQDTWCKPGGIFIWHRALVAMAPRRSCNWLPSAFSSQNWNPHCSNSLMR